MPIPGGTELIIILVIILLLFGAKRIPELARGLGTGVKEFRRGTRGEGDEVAEDKKKNEELRGGAAGTEAPKDAGGTWSEPPRPAERAEDAERAGRPEQKH